MSGGSSKMVSAASLRRTHTNEKQISFDIENDTDGGLKYSNTTDFGDRNREVLASNKSPIVVVDILKTLFFIHVWYTFSILLTLYNKELLGDDQGKFPTPLLINTIHFGMQAVFSKAIVYFWSERFQPTVTMSWKDYCMREFDSCTNCYRNSTGYKFEQCITRFHIGYICNHGRSMFSLNLML
ncbi:probable sugar phosphate/phosphate translocator At1g06470 isoform X5 [Helianthus annuus]|uniref:probable sugar phosphate/phosphate translocator At1g06470 isoform X5 n=1 Tax=Helianthus annuus TaxID=4232 RepID=UPI000B902F93|nr:probable sugar phosphate/phosphate translocator At1g06470 isoform X5 [Helianthus annuus]